MLVAAAAVLTETAMSLLAAELVAAVLEALVMEPMVQAVWAAAAVETANLIHRVATQLAATAARA
jgi:hypothetical protein